MFVRFAVQLPTMQCITTNVSDNNKQYRYISVLLLWSQIVLVCCFSGKCLMHRTVPVECLGECYCWLVLFENIIFFVCAEEICSIYTYVADSTQSSWVTCQYSWEYYWNATYDLQTEFNFIIYNLKITIFSPDICRNTQKILLSWSSS